MYSYCGIHAHDVCCFVPENAEPVGILPTPSRSRCGKKGFDSGHEGEADMAKLSGEEVELSFHWILQ